MRRTNQPAVDDGDEDWTLNRPELSLGIWKAMEATDWRHLPYPGGLLDQPDWLIQDLFVISWRKSVLKELSQSPLPSRKSGGRL